MCLGSTLNGSIRFGLANIPSDSLQGAFFPEWMSCLVGAIVLAVLTRVVVGAASSPRAGRWLSLLNYSALGAIFAFSSLVQHPLITINKAR